MFKETIEAFGNHVGNHMMKVLVQRVNSFFNN